MRSQIERELCNTVMSEVVRARPPVWCADILMSERAPLSPPLWWLHLLKSSDPCILRQSTCATTGIFHQRPRLALRPSLITLWWLHLLKPSCPRWRRPIAQSTRAKRLQFVTHLSWSRWSRFFKTLPYSLNHSFFCSNITHGASKCDFQSSFPHLITISKSGF